MKRFTEEEMWFQNGENRIFGIIYRPLDATVHKQAPAIIISHGFGGSYKDNLNCAEAYANKGFVVISFDFCGGSNYAKSDGSTMEMSICTEKRDLLCVLYQVADIPYVDQRQIYLWGESQGGVVTALTAAAEPEMIAGVVLLYPAFMLQDNARQLFDNYNMITSYSLWDMHVGPIFTQDLWDIDMYAEIAHYHGPVLLLQGDCDGIVPMRYSDRASQVYTCCEYHIIPGGGHGFTGRLGRKVDGMIVKWLEDKVKQSLRV